MTAAAIQTVRQIRVGRVVESKISRKLSKVQGGRPEVNESTVQKGGEEERGERGEVDERIQPRGGAEPARPSAARHAARRAAIGGGGPFVGGPAVRVVRG